MFSQFAMVLLVLQEHHDGIMPWALGPGRLLDRRTTVTRGSPASRRKEREPYSPPRRDRPREQWEGVVAWA